MTMQTASLPALVPYIPDNAPFSEDQRAWLNGFLAGIFSAAQPAAVADAPPSLKIAVLYASQSGTAEGLARKVAKELKVQRPHRLAHLARGLHARRARRRALCHPHRQHLRRRRRSRRRAALLREALRRTLPSLSGPLLLRAGARRLALRTLLQIRHRPRQQARLARRRPPLRPRRLRCRSRRCLRTTGSRASTLAWSPSSPRARQETRHLLKSS